MVSVNVTVKTIETDPTGQMITLTIEATIAEVVKEIRITEMVGNLAGKTDSEVKEQLKGIFKDVIRQKIGQQQELDVQKKWKRTKSFVGKTYTIEV